ncbi:MULTISPECIES: bifunctional aminoglycoside phosphotransferase/ATP-binding protein [unclassified Cyanobium]|uniref:bifunctional aminoglycoside phosphotransferase/ATP-binding protein n=1 Tax=unclassified Cyanobium TaxID=2627006 RepID=UPI0020CDFBD8|nr:MULTISPECIES: bifunctional aminoglycoside phosphotransferase/ATP-binding protein [unclassified Cyanobium]MCP9835327.1 AAA family ATPase [Cyanobium sp. La Preciosa 7G6]MCP9938093.1 AAA family ATPase [Cyanobium sp. Aljojuca 7A6]
MIAALLDPGAYDHPVERVDCLETHISWILLTGTVAYKIKKPVNLGFVDFSTPERRHWFCQEELRLNRRLAPDLYLGLSPIHGPPERATFRGSGPSLEWAVRMRQFPQSALLVAVLERHGLSDAQLEGLADDLAAFHAAAAVAGPDDPYGAPELVKAPAVANLEVLQACGLVPEPDVTPLRQWTDGQFEQLRPCFAGRRSQGRIRECHGDLHLGNMLLEGERLRVFDCLEFSPELRWIDVISDLAFLVMDLEHRNRADLGAVLLNRWLGHCGDYAGLLTWNWYRVYRSLVRAKVCALRLGQRTLSAEASLLLQQDLERYLLGASRATATPAPALVITHGVSGSGKSHRARQLCQRQGWIQLRSDVERKRLFGLWGQGPDPPLQGDPYRPEVSAMLYDQHLPEQADRILAAGLSVVVDATFLRRDQRQRMEALARERGVPFLILACVSSQEQAQRRLVERQARGGDPSDADGAVLASQFRAMEPLEGREWAHGLEVAALTTPLNLIASVAERLAGPGQAPP